MNGSPLAGRNYIPATEPEAGVEDRCMRPGLVRDASKECVRGVPIMRCVIKPPAEASEHLVAAIRRQTELNFSDNTSLAAARSTRKAGLCQWKTLHRHPLSLKSLILACTQHKASEPRMLQSIVTLSVEQHTISTLSQDQHLLLMLQLHQGWAHGMVAWLGVEDLCTLICLGLDVWVACGPDAVMPSCLSCESSQ